MQTKPWHSLELYKHFSQKTIFFINHTFEFSPKTDIFKKQKKEEMCANVNADYNQDCYFNVNINWKLNEFLFATYNSSIL